MLDGLLILRLPWSLRWLYQIDPSGSRVFDFSYRFECPVVEDRGMETLGLVVAVDRLRQGVVIRVVDGPDRWGDPIECELLCPCDGRVLRADLGVRPKLIGFDGVTLSAALSERHAEKDHHEIDMFAALAISGDDALRVVLEDECYIHPPCPGTHIGEVNNSSVVRSGSRKVTIEEVSGTDPILRGDRCPDRLRPGRAR